MIERTKKKGNILYCSNCKRQIKPHEIYRIDLNSSNRKIICGNCYDVWIEEGGYIFATTRSARELKWTFVLSNNKNYYNIDNNNVLIATDIISKEVVVFEDLIKKRKLEVEKLTRLQMEIIKL